jgi:hypothetical protein
MRDRVRESALASLFASKRFIVSLCAAIAMVLGTVSAGASVFTGAPADAESPNPIHAVFAETPSNAAASNEAPLFVKRQTLASQNIAVQSPLYTADASSSKDKKGFSLKLNQDAAQLTNALFYNPEMPLADAEEAPATSVALPAAEPADEGPGETSPPPSTGAFTDPADTEPQPSTEPTPSPDPTTEPSLNTTSFPIPEEPNPQP